MTGGARQGLSDRAGGSHRATYSLALYTVYCTLREYSEKEREREREAGKSLCMWVAAVRHGRSAAADRQQIRSQLQRLTTTLGAGTQKKGILETSCESCKVKER